jgi:hypothetical protein
MWLHGSATPPPRGGSSSARDFVRGRARSVSG